MLDGDDDKDFLLDGIKHGFRLHDTTPQRGIIGSTNANYRSAEEFHDEVEKQLLAGIEEGHYKILRDPPAFVSPISAVPKANGGIRVIHDLSSPSYACLNDHAEKDCDLKYQSVQDAISHLRPGYYMAKIDLKSAYRSVKTHPSSWPFTGLKWNFSGEKHSTFLCDTRLPFGARKSPGVFHRLTQAVRRSLMRQGFTPVVVYVDDFLIIASTFEECQAAFETLISLLRRLGFRIAWDKVVDPTQRLTFLGVEICSINGTLSLCDEKRIKLVKVLQEFSLRRRVSKKQLQKLSGKLSWASQVVPWGRLHTRTLFNRLALLHSNHHKCRVHEFVSDINWWIAALQGQYWRHIWDQRPFVQLCCDACNLAGGAFLGNDYYYTAWSADHPLLANLHINMKELAIVVMAILRWSWRLRNTHIVIFTDNIPTRGIINNGTSPCLEALPLLHFLCFMCIVCNIRLSALHIAGEKNTLADCISRLHEPGYKEDLPSLLSLHMKRRISYEDLDFTRHMSKPSLLFLLQKLRL